MEYRKIIGFGGNSYVVSIPKAWADKNNLKKGELLAVEQGHNSISFSPNNKQDKKEPLTITIETDNKPIELVHTEIIAAYLNNYDTIEIVSGQIKTNAAMIKEVLRNLAGIEIMLQTQNRIVAKDILDPKEISIKTILKRMDFITRAMIDDCIECIDGKEHHDDINQRDRDVNRLHFLAFRVIRSAMKNSDVMREFETNPWELMGERHIATKIEQIADQQKRIARCLKRVKMNKKLQEELKKAYMNIRESYLSVMKACYTKDKKAAFNIEITNRERILMCNHFLDESSEIFSYHTKESNPEKIDRKEESRYWTDVALIVENLKAMCSSIKYIARAIIEMD